MRALHLGQRNPPFFISEWHAHRLSLPVIGRRVGKPMSIRSPAGGLPLASAFLTPLVVGAVPPITVAGGGMASQMRSFRCASCSATPNRPRVCSVICLQILSSAASAIMLVRMLRLTRSFRHLWMSRGPSGSAVDNEENSTSISSDDVDGRWLQLVQRLTVGEPHATHRHL